MTPALTFFSGLVVLVIFGWYLATDISRTKRQLGLALIIALLALSVAFVYPPQEKIKRGLDLEGGTSFLIRLVKESTDKNAVITKTMQDQAVEVIRGRVDKSGIGEPVITPVGSDQIQVQLPGLSPEHIDEMREQLRRVAKLEFKLVHPQSQAIIAQVDAGQSLVPPGYRIETSEEHDPGAPPADAKKKLASRLLIKAHADMPGDRIVAAAAHFETQGWIVSLKFDSTGAKEFGELTRQHVGERLAIVLDGKVISAPNLNEPIYGGNAQISGSFTEAEARNLSNALENPLSTPVRIDEERSVSATLGKNAVNRGLYSGIAGLLLTFAFVLVYYRFAGVLASLALIVNIILLFGAMAMFGFVLTLPGIAGVILTIGMAIDANVLVYERLREELAAGKSLRPAIESAYHKAFSSIFDANITTLITSIILFWQAAGPVKGFAIALTLGIVASMFSALVATRNGFAWATEKGGLREIRMLNILHSPNFDFMGKARACILLSLAVILLCVGVFAWRGEKNFGIDFRGGDLLVMTTNHRLETVRVREALTPLKLEESVIQSEEKGGKQYLTIRSPINTGIAIEKRLAEAFPKEKLEHEQYEHVGALVGKQLAIKSLVALLLGIVGILIYVSLRFEFSFAIGAIVALLHDVVITIGVFSLLGRELSLVMVGAVLTIAGYSINDTIVVFDRIRSGLHEGRKGSVREIMNASINETLGRTVLTGSMTLVTVCALYFGGGPVLNDFALAILIGVLVGTYSSVFVASPIVLWFSRGEKNRLRQEVKPSTGPRPSAAEPVKI
jgi:SecD/SecF fusion protein